MPRESPPPARRTQPRDPAEPRDGSPAGTLQAGLVLAGRYQIVRYLGRGGMGEVYQALDHDLEGDVALKVVRPALASDWVMMERFRREIQLSRRVTHPNVCRIFDLGRHQDEERDVTFLTMELLPGETLEQKLVREGRMPVTEALPLIRQMAEGLGAAHAAGVIHRDFKASNVLLVSGKDGPRASGGWSATGGWRATKGWRATEGWRAVVTDFGLAGSLEDPDHLPGLYSSSDVVGTAAYVAPERLSGGPASPSSDVYSLGVVIYEMLTGARPHAGETPIEFMVNSVSAPPIAPRQVNPDLPVACEAVILRCLSREPQDRFASARDVAQALEEASGARPLDGLEEHAPGADPDLEKGLSRRRWLALTGTGAVALAILVAAFARLDSGSGPETHAGRRSIAVLGFRNLAGREETGWLSPALDELLRAALSDGRTFRTIPLENVHRMKAELGLGESETLSRATLSRVRANLSADLVVLGSYLVLGAGPASPLRVDISLQDTASGETLLTLTENRSIASLVSLGHDVSSRLRTHLGVSGEPEGGWKALRAALPTTPRAARLYSEGLLCLRSFALDRARELFQKSLVLDPSHARTHAALAQTLAALGLPGEAELETHRALASARPLSRVDQLLIEASVHESSGRWDQAIEPYQVLFGFFPDDVDHGLRLARAQTLGGDMESARRTTSLLRALPPPASGDPRIDLAEAAIAEASGDCDRALDLFESAARKSRATEAKLIVASSLLGKARCLGRLRQHGLAENLIRQVLVICQELSGTTGGWQAARVRAEAVLEENRLSKDRKDPARPGR
ncbi:MAG: protein kinase [Acidobacteria bacterium]|nr:protein kinase [Acidobacteriota bacterium]